MDRSEPLIGITLAPRDPLPVEDAQDYQLAVSEAGGDPLLVSSHNAFELERCQGVLLSGGLDLHPCRYRRHPREEGLSFGEILQRFKVKPEEARDEFEIPLAEKALERRIPLLGICRGFQLLNVVSGGGLVPDIQACVGREVKHRFKKGTVGPSHSVSRVNGTLLDDLLGPEDLLVNTYHHQGVTDAELAPGLTAACYAADGLVEAYFAAAHPFLVAVQWHPERRKDPEVRERGRRIFDAFVSAAREHV